MQRSGWWIALVAMALLAFSGMTTQQTQGTQLAQIGALDQAQEMQTSGSYSSADFSRLVAQTFTAGRTGRLDHIDVWIECVNGCQSRVENVVIQIQQVDTAGAPNATVLGSGIIAP